ncbi:MAG: hypothetical protein IH888_04215, partial [Planctomycetes bacterium]|nr:hypothetical protein [Planctomycetota bacterium]
SFSELQEKYDSAGEDIVRLTQERDEAAGAEPEAPAPAEINPEVRVKLQRVVDLIDKNNAQSQNQATAAREALALLG